MLKCKATAMITDPTAVAAKCSALGQLYDKGAIYVTIPELGMLGTELVYCRYGLSIPYIQIPIGTTLWAESTIGDTDRWIYTGFADCGGSVTPTTLDQFLVDLGLTIIYTDSTGKIYLTSKTAIQPFVLGTTLKTELQKIVDALTQLNADFTNWVVAPNDGGQALKTAVTSGFLTKAQAVLTSILSSKIFGA